MVNCIIKNLTKGSKNNLLNLYYVSKLNAPIIVSGKSKPANTRSGETPKLSKKLRKYIALIIFFHLCTPLKQITYFYGVLMSVA